MIKSNFSREPIDKICFILIALFSFTIVIFIGSIRFCDNESNQCFFSNAPKVQYFSWQDQKIGARDRGFSLKFDRPMSEETVEENLTIEPPLDGKISWAGKRLVYTLNRTAPYGRNYRLSLRNAREKFRGLDRLGAEIEPFIAEFQSRDRAFAYIGSEEEDRGRLILNNSTKQNKTILTPDDLTVSDFKFTENSEYIVFSAINENKNNTPFREVEIYRVTTGLSKDSSIKTPGILELILDGKDYLNSKFELAGDREQMIIVQRIKNDDPQDFDLWKVEAGKPPERLNTLGGDFIVTPDRQGIAIAQGEGIAIIPINGNKDNKLVNFLPKYGQILTFSADGTGAAMINFNKDNSELRFTNSLFYVNNQGIEKELLNTEGSIVDCKFNHSGTQLFCLLTELIKTETEMIEKPYFAAIDIASNRLIPLLALPRLQDIKISLAPDGLGLLFDQVITENDLPKKAFKSLQTQEELLTDSAELIFGSRIWLLTLPTSESPQAKLEELPISGFKPQWSP